MNVTALIEERAEDLGLEAAARRDALAGLPAHDATGLTESETRAEADAERCAKVELERIHRLLQQTQRAIANCDSSLARVRSARQGIEDGSPSEAANLDGLVRDRTSAVAAYNAFKADNKLTREATGDDRVNQVLWAAVIIVAEGLINSYFYAPVSPYGLLGGFIVAFFVSLANVFFAFAGGAAGLRYLSHIDPLKKLGGLFVALFCLGVCLLVVGLSTFYRAHVDLLQGQDMPAATMAVEAWGRALESLRSLEVWELIASINSFLLVLVGLMCAILAFYKGWQFDDRYPGLGAAFRAKERAKEAHEDAQRRQAEGYAEWRNDRIRELRRWDAGLDEAFAEERACIEGLRADLSANGKLGHETAQLAHGLLGVYRKKNAEVRADAAPAYFEAFPAEAAFAHFDADIERCTQEADELLGQVERQREEVRAEQDRIEQAVARVRNL